MNGDIPIIGRKPDKREVEVCRSFSRKLNLANYGGAQYESADFFSSRKLTCYVEDQPWVSQQLFEDCVAEVQASMAAYVETMANRRARRAS
jgi:hypothetical protein